MLKEQESVAISKIQGSALIFYKDLFKLCCSFFTFLDFDTGPFLTRKSSVERPLQGLKCSLVPPVQEKKRKIIAFEKFYNYN